MKRMVVFTSIIYLLCHIGPTHASFGFLKVFVAKTHPKCSQASSTLDAKFCPSFRATAQCACSSSGLPGSMCKDMNALHQRMLAVFETELAACQYQRDTNVQNCLDSWNCYRLGGKNSKGELCQTTGAACTT
jgi:hypothetical protein